jgi:hypothetical protein
MFEVASREGGAGAKGNCDKTQENKLSKLKDGLKGVDIGSRVHLLSG